MPHYSAAAMFARRRPDLVPGLSLVLDEPFEAVPEEEEDKEEDLEDNNPWKVSIRESDFEDALSVSTILATVRPSTT